MLSRGGRQVHEIPSWLLSEGTRRLSAIFAVLAVEPRPSLIVIEEIENGLDPWTLTLVYGALHDAAAEGIQIILTTHSPFLLDSVPIEDVIHVRREGGDIELHAHLGVQLKCTKYENVVPPGAMYVSDYFDESDKGRRG